MTATGKVYTSQGKWRLHADRFGSLDFDTPDTINFDSIIIHADPHGQSIKPQVHGYMGAVIDDSAIYLDQEDENEGNCFTRVGP